MRLDPRDIDLIADAVERRRIEAASASEDGGAAHAASGAASYTLLTVAELAEKVRLGHQAIRRAISRGELRAIKLCGQVRIEPTAFAEWTDAGQLRPSQAPTVTRVRARRPSSAAGLRRLLDKNDTGP
jgi:excisionase family DNA binding protein